MVHLVGDAGLEHVKHLGREAGAQRVRAESSRRHGQAAAERADGDECSVHASIYMLTGD